MEIWDLYDAEGKLVGTQIQRGETIPEGCYHRVVHIWIQNEKGEYLIQKRADHLKWHPGRWATTTGSVTAGEYNLVEAAYRELKEELGLDNTKIDLESVAEIKIGLSLVTILKGFLPHHIIQQIKYNEEVSELRWMSKSKIQLLRNDDSFASYSDETFQIAFQIKYQ